MKSKLKYLYRAVYLDNTIYDQNVDDVSVKDNNKSCYFDLNLDKIKFFTLSDGIHSYTLDLTDGGFSINGSPKIYLNTDQLSGFKLIHYRRVTMQISNDHRVMTINYVLGYTATNVDGETVTNQIIIR
jgi:hypothetical protein